MKPVTDPMVLAMLNNQQPQQQPQQQPPMGQSAPAGPPAGGMQPPLQPPASGQPPQGQQPFNPPQIDQKTQAMVYKMFPQLLEQKLSAQMGAQDPYKQALTAQAWATVAKDMQEKQTSPWAVVSGMLTKDGKPIQQNKQTGELRIGAVDAVTPTGGTQMAGVRKSQFTMQDLPSNQGPSTAGGAAYQVKVAARQGMNLIARPGSPQRSAIATADLARAVTRVAPTDESMRSAGFSDNLVTRWSTVRQKLNANPEAVNNPEIRREMYKIFKEMDESATPFIEHQLDDMADAGLPVTPGTRKRQLGLTLPTIEFQENIMPPQAGGTAQTSGWSPNNESRLQELLRKKQNGTLGN